jgi:hypothetical protein
MYIVIIGLILQFVLVVYRNDLPGVNASIEIRQKWAYEKFDGYTRYTEVVNRIEGCNQIKTRVGKIKFIAPTKGINFVIYDPGSLADYNAELTLEGVGEKGTGIAYMKIWSDD